MTDTKKTFFDPHPGFAGALIPIPTAVKKVADKLDGKVIFLHEAAAKIQAVTSGTVSIKDGWIMLEFSEPDGTRHGFRVIRFS